MGWDPFRGTPTPRSGHTYLDDKDSVDAAGNRVGYGDRHYTRDADGKERYSTDDAATLADRASYGGSRDFAAKEAGSHRRDAEGWASAQMRQADMRGADAARNSELASRGEQLYGLKAANAAADGRGPSAAGAQFSANNEAGIMAAAAGGGVRAYAPNAALAQYSGARGAESSSATALHSNMANNVRQGDEGMSMADTQKQRALADDFYRQRGTRDRMEGFYRDMEQGVNINSMNARDFTLAQQRARKLQEDRFYADAEANRAKDTARGVGVMMDTYASMAKASDAGLKRYIGRMR